MTEKIKVFISYSRQDKENIDQLYQALSGDDELEVFLDKHDIAAAEDWKARLENLIRAADTVIFATSPTSASSDICRWELEQAAALNKRILPVILEDVPDGTVPDEIARLNYIFLRNDAEFKPALISIGETLKIDIDWVREHTRIGEIARRWDLAQQLGAQPLRGKELAGAEKWLSDQPKDAPPPTEQQRRYIYQSRKAATRRQRVTVTGSLVALIIVGVLGVFSWVQRDAAVSSKQETLNRESVYLANISQELVKEGRADEAVLVALQGLPDSSAPTSRPLVPETLSALLDASIRTGILASYTPDSQTERRYRSGLYQMAVGDGDVTASFETNAGAIIIRDHRTHKVLSKIKIEACAQAADVRFLHLSQDNKHLSFFCKFTFFDYRIGDGAIAKVPVRSDIGFGDYVSSDDGSRLAFGGGSAGVIFLWDRLNGVVEIDLDKKKIGIKHYTFLPGNRFAIVDSDALTVHDLTEGVNTVVNQFTMTERSEVSAIQTHQNGSMLAVTYTRAPGQQLGTGYGVEFFYLETNERRRFAQQSSINNLDFHPNGGFVALGLSDGSAEIWDFRGERLRSFLATPSHAKQGQLHRGVTAQFSQNGQLLLLASYPRSGDGELIAYSVVDKSLQYEIRFKEADEQFLEHGFSFFGLSPDRNTIALSLESGLVQVWDTRSWVPVAVAKRSSLFPNGTLAIGKSDGAVVLIQENGVVEPYDSGSPCYVMAKYAPRSLLAIGCKQGEITVFSVMDGLTELTSIRTGHAVTGLRFSPKGEKLAITVSPTTHNYRHFLLDLTARGELVDIDDMISSLPQEDVKQEFPWTSMAFVDEDKIALINHLDRVISVIDINDGIVAAVFRGLSIGEYLEYAISSEGDLFAYKSAADDVLVVDLSATTKRCALASKAELWDFDFFDKGRKIVGAEITGDLVYFNAADCAEYNRIARRRSGGSSLPSLDVQEDLKFVLLGYNSHVSVHDLQTGAELYRHDNISMPSDIEGTRFVAKQVRDGTHGDNLIVLDTPGASWMTFVDQWRKKTHNFSGISLETRCRFGLVGATEC